MDVKCGCMPNATKSPATFSRFIHYSHCLNIVSSRNLKLKKRHFVLFGLMNSVFLKNLGGTDYFCPTCKVKFNFELSDSEKSHPKVK